MSENDSNITNILVSVYELSEMQTYRNFFFCFLKIMKQKEMLRTNCNSVLFQCTEDILHSKVYYVSKSNNTISCLFDMFDIFFRIIAKNDCSISAEILIMEFFTA